DRMFVWGGVYFFIDSRQQRQYVYLNDGRQYDPATDTWSPVSGLNAPAPRAGHVAIWTGEKVLVWGGSGTTTGGTELRGGRYDPSLDTWETTSANTTLNAFGGYTGIAWTGNVMVVWGQSNGPTDSGMGGRYDPFTDSWVATSTESAPPAGGALAWIGNGMLVWQEKIHLYGLSSDADHDGVTVCGGDCNDGNPAVLPGAFEVCNGIDDNCDSLVDETFDGDGDGRTTCGGDCNDADPSAWGSPAEVSAVLIAMEPPVTITWASQSGSSGPGTVYDLVSGTRADLSAFDGSMAVCVSPGGMPPVTDDRSDPAGGQVFWYLVRARNSCGTGTYGSPALDNSIPACF
ncbi:MAG: MopE-related protein, partial [bacterium]